MATAQSVVTAGPVTDVFGARTLLSGLPQVV
ncbi:hypothetical protein SAMN04515673_10418 [Poseidonocella sedimentorum]|uniref:Uncharacterized protein n=1 Tax=Poseidonocella sedimentorum TaxID=871652 RepID=A0A1I6DKC0_9RHOB|nr:hypothetical protein SAMN04515673_10418 [Poseidonocella sedimentorum]